ncbi:DUF1707 domain-containing protein [Nonomuraea sp. M3C6]|uniref:DUF1707 domain-containing protein n=1 Tax=Nonomuraea marmarensis TaxID=3351344 RepID=A0ABW7AL48_9ACTN
MTDDPALRASDADRDRVAAALGEALATGRFTSADEGRRCARSGG